MRRIPLHDVSLVLGGGAGRGQAHIGAWRALQERAVTPRRVVGSSVGALVGACIAAGMSWQELASRSRNLSIGSLFSLNTRVLSQGLRSPSLLREEPLRELIRAVLPVRKFSDLAMPLSINAVDLSSGSIVWFGERGRTDVSLADAIYASCALPVLLPPALIDGCCFVDGGIVDPLPIERARELGAREIVAIDLSTAGEVRGRLPGMVETYCRAFQLLRDRSGAASEVRPAPDLTHIQPALEGRHAFDLGRSDDLVELGYRASLRALGDLDYPPPPSKLEVVLSGFVRDGESSAWIPSWLTAVPASLARLAWSR